MSWKAGRKRGFKTRRNRRYVGGRAGGRTNGPVDSCPPPQCQASESCNNPLKKGNAVCEAHAGVETSEKIKSPTTGFEPKYNPKVYNRDKAVQHSHNCFAYAMGVYDKKKIEECRKNNDCKFHVPGKTKGHAEFSGQMGKTCSDVLSRTMADIPNGYVTNFETPCNPNYSKVAIVVDEINDLHYYRQDSDGMWSHKPGGRPVTNKDAYGAKIYRPDRASRCYPRETPEDSGLNYDSFCSYMCVPRTQPIVVAGGGINTSSKERMGSSTKRNYRRKVGGGWFTSKLYNPKAKTQRNLNKVLRGRPRTQNQRANFLPNLRYQGYSGTNANMKKLETHQAILRLIEEETEERKQKNQERIRKLTEYYTKSPVQFIRFYETMKTDAELNALINWNSLFTFILNTNASRKSNSNKSVSNQTNAETLESYIQSETSDRRNKVESILQKLKVLYEENPEAIVSVIQEEHIAEVNPVWTGIFRVLFTVFVKVPAKIAVGIPAAIVQGALS